MRIYLCTGNYLHFCYSGVVSGTLFVDSDLQVIQIHVTSSIKG